MKTSITQKLMGLALSLLSITSFGQCAQITGMNVTLGANGTASVNPVISAPGVSGSTHYYWQVWGGATQTSGPLNQQGTFQFHSNGQYYVCLQFNDSLNMCSSNQYCDTIVISNMSSTACLADFTAHTDSSCVTHFVNASTGSNLTYQWNINGSTYTSANPSVSLGNGTYNAFLLTYSGGVFCDSAYHYINVNCGSNPGGSCNASFTHYPDSTSCNTQFYNLSTGSNLTYEWVNLTSGFALLSTQQHPNLNLGTGNHTIGLYTYSGGQLCDSATALVSVTCNTVNPCQVNSQFSVFADSVNTGNYFAYNISSGSGSLTYLWNFGDGSSSTQQYPFHQYAAPGQYVICLTVTATNGTVTCSDTYCDSSSVQRMASGFLMNQIQVIPQTVTSVKDQSIITGLKTFPNPMADELTVEMELNPANHALNYQLVDALGKVIVKNNITDSKTLINTSTLEQGFYFLQIMDEKGETLKTTKLVK